MVCPSRPDRIVSSHLHYWGHTAHTEGCEPRSRSTREAGSPAERHQLRPAVALAKLPVIRGRRDSFAGELAILLSPAGRPFNFRRDA